MTDFWGAATEVNTLLVISGVVYIKLEHELVCPFTIVIVKMLHSQRTVAETLMLRVGLLRRAYQKLAILLVELIPIAVWFMRVGTATSIRAVDVYCLQLSFCIFECYRYRLAFY